MVTITVTVIVFAIGPVMAFMCEHIVIVTHKINGEIFMVCYRAPQEKDFPSIAERGVA